MSSPHPTNTIPPSASGQVWAIGGAKGGTGKSLLASNLGIAVAGIGYEVCVIDTDVGGANLHTILGLPEPERGLEAFLNKRVATLRDLLIPTGIPKLHLISGAHPLLGGESPTHASRQRFLRELSALSFDVVILDLASGSSASTLDAFVAAQKPVVVAAPEPTAVENLYRFLKRAYYRALRARDTDHRLTDLLFASETVRGTAAVESPAELFEELARLDAAGAYELEQRMRTFAPRLIMNQVRSGADGALADQMCLTTRKYFGIAMTSVGCLEYDEAIWKSVRTRRPFLLEYPSSRTAHSMRAIASELLG